VDPAWTRKENLVYKQPRVYTILSDTESPLSSPPATSYGEISISFSQQTPQQSMQYGGSLLALPPSAIPPDPFATPSASASIIARRYIQSEENISRHVETEGGMEETWNIYTPIPRKFELSDSSEDDNMTEMEWRDEEPYMTPTKKGKKQNKSKGVKRSQTPKRPIPNMPQAQSRRRLKADWAKPAEKVTNEGEPANGEALIGEYLRNTNGLRDFVVGQEDRDVKFEKWCGK